MQSDRHRLYHKEGQAQSATDALAWSMMSW